MSAEPGLVSPGTIYIVGGGPGPADLVSVRASAILARADFVAHDPDLSAEVLALCPAGAERVVVSEGSHSAQVALARTLADQARLGRVVVRLSSGDGVVFARAGQVQDELHKLRAPLEIVPGVSAPAALAAFTGVRATDPRDVSPSVTLLRVQHEYLNLFPWERLATATDSLVAIVDRDTVSEVARALITEGRSPSTPSAVAARVGLPSQAVKRGTLSDIATRARALEASVLTLVVGEAVAHGPPRSWFESRPLFGKRVLVTRARDQAPLTARLLRARGAEPVVVPTIAIHPLESAELDAALLGLARTYDWVAFTSANGVEATFRRIHALGRDARVFGPARIAAIGPGTAQSLEAFGLRADVVAKEFKGEGLAEELLRQPPAADVGASRPPRILIARAREAREALPDMLRSAGWTVDVLPVYETRPVGDAAREAIVPQLRAGRLDAVLFTSGSTVTTFLDLLGEGAAELLARTVLASIGPITTAALEKRGFQPQVTAAEYTLPGLVRALEAFLESRGSPA